MKYKCFQKNQQYRRSPGRLAWEKRHSIYINYLSSMAATQFRHADLTIISSISQEIYRNRMSRLPCKNADIQKSPLLVYHQLSLVHPQNLSITAHLTDLVFVLGPFSLFSAAIATKPSLSPCDHKANMVLVPFFSFISETYPPNCG